jgi:hypothetical protein
VSPPERPRLHLPELSGDLAIKAAFWLVSVAVLNALVGSPVTDLYVGFSIVGAAMWIGSKAAGFFDEPPASGALTLVDADERRYRGRVDDDGTVSFTDPEGHRWTGSAWSGRWTLTDPSGGSWWGRVGRKGDVRVHDEAGHELHGRLDPDA